jgi:hypothetical protein
MNLIMRVRWSKRPAARSDFGRPGSNLLIPALERRGSLFPYVASAGLHISFIAGALAIAGLFPSPDQIPQPRYLGKFTIIRLPKQKLHLKLPAVPQTDPVAVADRLRTRVTQLVGQMQSDSIWPRSTPDSGPRAHSVKQPKAILFQPEFPLDLEPPATSEAVPSVLVWTKEIAQNPPKRLVPPVPTQEVVSSPELDATPQEVRSAFRIVDAAPALQQTVVSPPADRLPAVPADKQTDSKPAATDTRAVRVFSLSNAPAAAGTIVVPPGNLLPPATATDGIRPSVAEGNAPAGGALGLPSTRDDSLHLAGPGSSNTPIAPPIFPSLRVAVLPAEPVVAPPALVRGLDHAVNGRFDVVVIQTSMDESLPPGLLNGKPIYTVYLPVGDTREWAMHYCASQASVVQRGAIVQLPDPRPLDAPYPRLTFLPAEPITGSGPHVLVYGVVDESGSFQNLRVIGPIQSGKSSLLEALGKWRFRPAMRAGSPALVEMVLAIPVSKS